MLGVTPGVTADGSEAMKDPDDDWQGMKKLEAPVLAS
jgi:hypothetical protein